MRIVYCKDSLGNSAGMERVLCTKVNYFADILGYEVHIVLVRPIPENLFFEFSPKVKISSLGITIPRNNLLEFFLKTDFMKEYERKLDFILHELSPDITISMFGSEIQFLYKIKDGSVKILESHFSRNYLSHLMKALPNTRIKWLKRIWAFLLQSKERYYAKKYSHIVLLTQKDKALWGGGDQFFVIPNPLSFMPNRKAALENKQMVAIGRYIAQKGFDFLIRAYAEIADYFPDWKLFIYGEGQDKEFLQHQINTLSLQDVIFLKEPIHDVEEKLLASSLFVFPSLYEGFGLVLTEAMACGVPCVAFDCECGPSEIITDNEDGFLVETKNIQELSKKMKILMQSPELCKKMGEKAKVNVLRYSVDEVMNSWVMYFKKIKGKNGIN